MNAAEEYFQRFDGGDPEYGPLSLIRDAESIMDTLGRNEDAKRIAEAILDRRSELLRRGSPAARDVILQRLERVERKLEKIRAGRKGGRR